MDQQKRYLRFAFHQLYPKRIFRKMCGRINITKSGLYSIPGIFDDT